MFPQISHTSFFIPSSKPTKYTTIFGEYLDKVQPGSIKDCREFLDKYKDISNFKIYGNNRYQYCYISDNFPGSIDWDFSKIRVASLDIEVGESPSGGYASVDEADGQVTAITVYMDGKFVTFGTGMFETTREDITYHNCRDEIELLHAFISWWYANYPDIISGWNCQHYDIPYLVNRICIILGESQAKRLSPWNVINENTMIKMGREVKVYSLLGIAILDLFDLYQKYAPEGKSQESYRLDNIAHVELGERKLSYEEYGSLHNLYKKNYQLFLDYNIKDVDLVNRIDAKHKLIELALTLAYDNKCNYEDVYYQTKMWDCICFNHLKSKHQVFPSTEKREKDHAYIGAYVKEPITGFHHWVASFDVASEYPSILWGSNISPETIVEPKDYTDGMRKIISQGVTVDKLLNQEIDLSILESENVCLTANGQFYRRDKQGFVGEMVEKMFNERKIYKKAMLDAEKELELIKQEIERRKMQNVK